MDTFVKCETVGNLCLTTMRDVNGNEYVVVKEVTPKKPHAVLQYMLNVSAWLSSVML